jgi:hypothetical protein
MKTLHLHVHDGVRSATLLFSRFPVVVGRDPTAQCRLEFPTVSRQHARIDLRDGRLTICDEGSLVGTWVLGKTRRLQPGVMTDFESVGYEFSIGDLHLRAELREITPTEDVVTSEMRRKDPNVETSCYADADIDPAALDADALEEALVEALEQRRRADTAVADILRQATAIAPAQLARLARLVVESDPEWDGHAAVRQFVTTSGVCPEPARVDTTALRALQELSATYVPYGPPLGGIEAVTAFVTRLDAVLDVLFDGVAALRYGYRCERGAPPSRGPNRADLAANLLDWTHDSAALEHLQNEFSRMLVHHSHVVGEASFGLQRILERLSPQDIQNDPRCEGKWGPWRYKAYWKELERRAAVLGRMRESAMGPAFGQAAKALRSRAPAATHGHPIGHADA